VRGVAARALAAAVVLLAAEARGELPTFMKDKRPLRDDDVAEKVEGGYFTGLPLANSDPDTGFGFGARVYRFENGARDSELFRYTPYRHRLFAQAFFATKGYQYHLLDWDAPYLDDTPFRLKGSLIFERNSATNYFGNGTRTLDRLRYPGADRTFASYDDYAEAQRSTGGGVFTRYDQYILTRPKAVVSVERDFFGGLVRALVGFNASYVSVDQWTGRDDEGSVQAPTRLEEDCAGGRARGCNGGFNNSLKLGLAFDTRDFEPDPNSGAFIELTTELAGRPIGSQFDWARATFSPKFYWSPFPKLTDLVVATRLVGQVQTADTPVFSMNELSFTDVNREGLGGLRTMRGYKLNRFVGRALALANIEVRWTFAEIHPLRRQRFAFMIVPFFDVGRVFDSIYDFELARFRHAQGAGFRIAWNQATIINFDYGISREGQALYINFNHPF
jgi:outer membrane protein assembly factor BamA